MEFVDKNTIRLDREINELDEFVLKFLRILEKHTEYVVISGYISILLGRSRATEDIDVFVKPLKKEKFYDLYTELKEKGYWCLNAESENEVYDYLVNNSAIRFAEINQTIPNFEVKFAVKPLQLLSFENRIKVKTSNGEIIISSLELQIAFKKYYLKSEKDLEDAKHIEKVFKDEIDYNLIEKYKGLLE